MWTAGVQLQLSFHKSQLFLYHFQRIPSKHATVSFFTLMIFSRCSYPEQMRSRKWSTDGACNLICYLLGKQHFLNKYKKGLLTAKQELFFWLIHSVTFESVLFALMLIFFYFHFWFAVITACNMTSWKVLLKTCHSGLLICLRLQNKRERSRVQIWTRSNCQNKPLFIFFSTKATV